MEGVGCSAPGTVRVGGGKADYGGEGGKEGRKESDGERGTEDQVREGVYKRVHGNYR